MPRARRREPEPERVAAAAAGAGGGRKRARRGGGGGDGASARAGAAGGRRSSRPSLPPLSVSPRAPDLLSNGRHDPAASPTASPSASPTSTRPSMRQRPLVVEKTLPVLKEPGEVPAFIAEDPPSARAFAAARPAAAEVDAGQNGVAAAGGRDKDLGPDRQLEIPIPSCVLPACTSAYRSSGLTLGVFLQLCR